MVKSYEQRYRSITYIWYFVPCIFRYGRLQKLINGAHIPFDVEGDIKEGEYYFCGYQEFLDAIKIVPLTPYQAWMKENRNYIPDLPMSTNQNLIQWTDVKGEVDELCNNREYMMLTYEYLHGVEWWYCVPCVCDIKEIFPFGGSIFARYFETSLIPMVESFGRPYYVKYMDYNRCYVIPYNGFMNNIKLY